jgi:hypothetical protein
MEAVAMDDGLPEHLQTQPAADRWDFPTAWLLGSKLVASLRDIVLSGLFDFDPRDWMAAGQAIDLRAAITGDGCWIDYMADTGDSPRLVFQLAYLMQQKSLTVADADHTFALPAASLLVMGGDTAYPVATRRRLVERIRAPFIWARRALGDRAVPEEPARPLVGIPGNHDYYNLLDGYRGQFRAAPANATAVKDPASRLDIPGFALVQQASYFAVRLPYDWELWALDVERAAMDDRQRAYFAEHCASCPCDKRIIATSKPAFVYHAPSPRAQRIASDLRALGFGDAPFLTGGTLAPPQVRLDLSGDDHIYERYWGTTVSSGAGDRWSNGRRVGNETRRHQATPQRANYASVVSGLGGAFHHPGQVRFGTSAPQAAWPTAEASARAVGECLIRPRKVFQAGAVGVVGAAVSALCFLLASLRGPAMIDAPFFVLTQPDAFITGVTHFGIVAAIVASIGACIGAIALGIRWGKRLARRVTALAPPVTGWEKLTRWVAELRPLVWVLRFLGGNTRSAWTVLITVPAWLFALAINITVLVLLYRCPELAAARDGYVPLYTVTVLIVLGMGTLGAVVGGARVGLAGRVLLALFGAAVGVLIVWTPYAWTRLTCLANGMWWIALFFAYPLVRRFVLRSGFMANTLARRVVAVLVFVMVAAFYVLVPHFFVPAAALEQPPVIDATSLVAAPVFGAYFACLWIGWYFFVCLQFNTHGNEAGSAARVVQFAEFLRIKLTDHAAEVWAIAAEDDGAGGARARLIDHFTVSRPEQP